MLEALEVRRRSMQAERRKSQMQTLGLNNGIVNNNRSQRVSAAGTQTIFIFPSKCPPIIYTPIKLIILPQVSMLKTYSTAIKTWHTNTKTAGMQSIRTWFVYKVYRDRQQHQIGTNNRIVSNEGRIVELRNSQWNYEDVPILKRSRCLDEYDHFEGRSDLQ